MSLPVTDSSKGPPVWHTLQHYIPILDWGPRYRPSDWVGDLTAGIIVASLLIPQSMAYALLAGLPPQMGLYASILPQVLYAVFGTSRVLSVAPVAVDSLMVATAVSALAAENTPEYLNLAILLALMVGAMKLVLGILRLGFLVNFLSQAVISGFISAAAILIGFSQLKHLFGIAIPQTESFLQLLRLLLQGLPSTNPITLSLGLASLGLLLYFSQSLGRHLKSRGWADQVLIPVTKSAPLLVVILGSVLAWGLNLESVGVKVVGTIPRGLPSWSVPAVTWAQVEALLPAALALTFVGFMEAYAIGKFLASKRQQKVDANQELVALGVANLGAGLTGGYPITGGLSRSVVNFSAGANTSLALIVTAGVLALTVMFLTPLFYFLPQACLAAIILVAVSHLLDFATLKRLWWYNRWDAIAWLVTFFLVLATNVEMGILLGVALSLLLHLWRTSQPHIAVVGRLGDTEHFRNVLRHPVQTCPHVLALRVDESLYFVNTKYLEDFVLSAVAAQPQVKYLLLVCNAINLIDGSALETLRSLNIDLQNRGVTLCLSEVKGPVMDRLQRAGFVDEVGCDRIFLSTDQAMRSLGCV